MKLNIDGCREYIKRNCISSYSELSEELGVEVSVLHLWKAGGKMGYDAVRDIYIIDSEKR